MVLQRQPVAAESGTAECSKRIGEPRAGRYGAAEPRKNRSTRATSGIGPGCSHAHGFAGSPNATAQRIASWRRTVEPRAQSSRVRPATAANPRADRPSAPVIGNGFSAASVVPGIPAGEAAAAAGSAPVGSASGPDALASLLRPTLAASGSAQVLPARRLLLPRGAFIDCTLETAIDSSLPGMTTCILATDTFGADGKVVLLERGTKLIGETRGEVQQGAARVFVLWTEARTPTGIVVPLDSPGADELGRSGLGGQVNRHFWERFGAAMLISIVDGAVQAAATRNGGGTVIVAPSASGGVVTEVLKGTVSIPPTVTKNNGDRIQVLVARDVDFRSVYELRSVADR